MKKQLCLLIMYLPLLTMAQSFDSTHASTSLSMMDKGIKWTTGLSWEQVKQKAKAENKYIFIDAYTTWCGPCKMMDKYVYPNDTVGNFFNEHFIAVKAQMDITDKDVQSIKDWYNDAKKIEGEYWVTAYPSLIFLSPDAIILYKMEGFRPAQKFVDTSKLVITSGTAYNDPYKEYKALVNDYKQGIKHYERMPYMIQTAFKLNDSDLAREMFKDHLNYVSMLNENQRYTKQNIELWNSVVLKLDSKALGFLLKDGHQIDKVMNQKGFSRDIVDNTIQARIVDSFFRMQKGEITINGFKRPESDIMFQQLPVREDGKPLEIEPAQAEADWIQLEKMIRKSFNSDYAARNVLAARYRWYQQHQNRVAALKMYFTKLDKWPPAKLELETNQFAWFAFLYSNDKELLNKASKWQGKLIQQLPDRPEPLDTYANLLYKLGRTKEAIRWEEKALSVLPAFFANQANYKEVIERMKRGEPTYLEQGAIWTNK